MKIIRNYSYNPEWNGEATCNDCDARLSLNFHDLNLHTDTPYPGRFSLQYKCVVCGQKNTLKYVNNVIAALIKKDKEKLNNESH